MRGGQQSTQAASRLNALRRSLLRAVNRYGPSVGSGRLHAASFDLDGILDEARQRTHLDDFGDDEFLGPLRFLLDAYEQEAELTFIGRMSMREDAVSMLVARLHICADRQRFPEIADADLQEPLFITGLPRSGTTFLHTLLAADPRWRAPAGWEVMYPSPPPGARADPADRRCLRADRRMKKLYWLTPGFAAIHELDAQLPQECIAITGATFISDMFPTMCHVPSYQRWLDKADQVPAYRYHRRFLQHLQGGAGGLHWLLKAPAHLFGLRALLEVYPDARIVFLHREPREVLPSLANLTQVLRGAFSDRHAPAATGAELRDHWSRGVREARAVIGSLRGGQERFADLA